MEDLEKDAIMRVINNALNSNTLVRIENDYKKAATRILVDGVIRVVLPRTILYPGYLNCTSIGTPARVVSLKSSGGFGKEGLEDVVSYSTEMSDRYNKIDFPLGVDNIESYYGSDRWLEDGEEARGRRG